MTIAKPPHGSPCNSCGVCCESVLCPLGHGVFYGELTPDCAEGPCPALETQPDGRKLCGLIETPVAYSLAGVIEHGEATLREAASFLVGTGRGCDAQVEDEPANPDFVAHMAAYRLQRSKSRDQKAARALAVWSLI